MSANESIEPKSKAIELMLGEKISRLESRVKKVEQALEADRRRRQELDAARPLKTEMDTLVEHEMRLRALEGARVATSPLMQLLCSPPPWPPKPAPKKDAPKDGWRIAISDEPAPCPTCGQMVYEVKFTFGKKAEPEPKEDKPTPKPGEVWITADESVLVTDYIEDVFHRDPSERWVLGHGAPGNNFRHLYPRGGFLRPATADEADAFWGR